MPFSAGIDIGGTFTDGFFTLGNRAVRTKVLTTYHDLSECFIRCLEAGAELLGADLAACLSQATAIRLATTLGTNVLLERNGPTIGLIVTKGAEPGLYHEPDSSVPALLRYIARPEMIVGIEESMGPDGISRRPPDHAEVLNAVRALVGRGARRIGVCLRHAGCNPQHEIEVRERIRDAYPEYYLRSLPVQLAHGLTSSSDDRIRIATAAVNAYLHGALAAGLYRSESLARERGLSRPLLVGHADGGCARVAKTVAVQTLSSGPAAALAAAARLARVLGIGQVVTMDMGGTSLDFSVIDGGEPQRSGRPVVMGLRLGLEMLQTTSIGAGGGSIAGVAGGEVAIGPESAGSNPGPACYNKGGSQPTVTDANVVLGFVSADQPLGGRIRLSKPNAEEALARVVGRPLGLNPVEAARAVRAAVDAAMADAISHDLRQRGLDPAELSLFALGGGGPLHACSLAGRLGIGTVVGFQFSSVFGAYACCTLDLRHSHRARLDGYPAAEQLGARVTEVCGDLRRRAESDIAGEGFEPAVAKREWELLVEDSTDEVRLPFPDRAGQLDSRALADSATGSTTPAQAVGVTLRTTVPLPHWQPERAAVRPHVPEPTRKQPVHWDGEPEPLDTPVYQASDLHPGACISGPALIDSPDTRWVVSEDWQATCDTWRNLVLRRG
jgi:N-methylhydantoinase A/oxoprolinase/acetone carboxylase beta subunit